MRQPVAQHDLARHADAFELGALERGDVDAVSIGPRVQRHVDERACRVLDGLEALIEAPGCLEPVDQLVGDGLPGRMMQRVPLQDRRLEGPVLEQLRRQLDEVAQHLRAGQALVGDLRKQAVQPVPELVEQSAHVVGRQQRRLARGSFGEVVVVDDDRQRLAVRARLPAIGAHPRAATLVRTGVVVAQEEPDRSAVAATHFEDRDIGVVGADVRDAR